MINLNYTHLATLSAFFAAALSMGIGAIGPAVGIGYAAGKGVEGMMRQPASHGSILKTMLIGQAVSEWRAIFALLVALSLLFTKVD